MPLTCWCDGADAEYYWRDPEETTFIAPRGKRCQSCGRVVRTGDIGVRFLCSRYPRHEIEERIWGDAVEIAPKWMCEECGDLFWSLDELGFRINLGENMRELAREYGETYGPFGGI